MIDPLTIRNTDDSFNLKHKDKTYSSCRVLSLGQAIGRLTTVFETNDLYAVKIIEVDEYLP